MSPMSKSSDLYITSTASSLSQNLLEIAVIEGPITLRDTVTVNVTFDIITATSKGNGADSQINTSTKGFFVRG